MDTGLIAKLSDLCSKYYTLKTIDDLFLYAGADATWWSAPATPLNGERRTRFRGWVEGIQQRAPEHLDMVVLRVANEIAGNNDVPEQDRKRVQQAVETRQKV